MGSRGSFIKTGGFTAYNYKTLIRFNKVRFVVQTNGKPIKIPERSNSKNSVYVTLAKSGEIQSITFYNAKRSLYKEIDFLHPHNGMKPHVHEINPNAVSFRDGETHTLSKKEKLKVQRIQRFFEKHNVRDLAKEEYSK